MMIKVFQKNKNGKVQLSTEELEKILNEAYWEGYYQNNSSWVYTTPKWDYITTAVNDNGISINCDNISNKKITIN